PGDFLIDPAFGRWAFAAQSSEQSLLLDSLTQQERAIVALREEGFSLHEIADHLCITESTVKRHLANISAKRKQRRERE
ncbi:MAG: helix-turn-helix transcriptional regulator, partial [Ktedonobacteraceae bacterium]